MRYLFLYIAIGVSCMPERQRDNNVVEWREYLLLDKNIPKHFYVDLLDTKTGQKYISVYVSKHCNSHGEGAVVGKLYKLKRVTWTEGGTTHSEFEGLYEIFCK